VQEQVDRETKAKGRVVQDGNVGRKKHLKKKRGHSFKANEREETGKAVESAAVVGNVEGDVVGGEKEKPDMGSNLGSEQDESEPVALSDVVGETEDHVIEKKVEGGSADDKPQLATSASSSASEDTEEVVLNSRAQVFPLYLHCICTVFPL
jgi:hypothetical protein